MVREETVFGPIKSRRLGMSLGINLLPVNGKICNFDCVYCECGLNKDGRDDTKLPTRAQVRSALENKLSEFLLDGTRIDSITFSGDGESTLHPEFAQIIDDVIELRDIYFPDVKICVLSNSTMVWKDSVFQALRKVDNPMLKIDAPTNELAAKINCPAPGYDVARVVESLKRFDGDFILQVMFLKGKDFDTTTPQAVRGMLDIIRYLRPRKVMAYSIDRPVPTPGLERIMPDQIRSILAPLVQEGFDISVF